MNISETPSGNEDWYPAGLPEEVTNYDDSGSPAELTADTYDAAVGYSDTGIIQTEEFSTPESQDEDLRRAAELDNRFEELSSVLPDIESKTRAYGLFNDGTLDWLGDQDMPPELEMTLELTALQISADERIPEHTIRRIAKEGVTDFWHSFSKTLESAKTAGAIRENIEQDVGQVIVWQDEPRIGTAQVGQYRITADEQSVTIDDQLQQPYQPQTESPLSQYAPHDEEVRILSNASDQRWRVYTDNGEHRIIPEALIQLHPEDVVYFTNLEGLLAERQQLLQEIATASGVTLESYFDAETGEPSASAASISRLNRTVTEKWLHIGINLQERFIANTSSLINTVRGTYNYDQKTGEIQAKGLWATGNRIRRFYSGMVNSPSQRP